VAAETKTKRVSSKNKREAFEVAAAQLGQSSNKQANTHKANYEVLSRCTAADNGTLGTNGPALNVILVLVLTT